MEHKELSAVVTNIQRYCVDDGEGIRTTVFLKGCPLRCVWCHNPETYSAIPQLMHRKEKCTACGRCVTVCPERARTVFPDGAVTDREKCTVCGKCAEVCPACACEVCGKEMTVSEVIAIAARDKIFYETSGGGLTVSGGECSMHPEFTLALISAAKERGIGAAVETCGYGKSEFFLEALRLGVSFLYDIKEMDPEKHKRLCGVSNGLILSNLEMLMGAGADITIRIPLIPGVNDSDEEISAIAEFLKVNRLKYRTAQIMPYHPLGTGKAASLGISQIAVAPELYENDCASSKERWYAVFSRYGVEVR